MVAAVLAVALTLVGGGVIATTGEAGAVAAPVPGSRVTAPKPLAGVVVNLDPGHNPGNARNARKIARVVQAGPIRKACDTVGAATRAGWPEHRFTLQLATRVVRRLRAQGATVTLTHDALRPAWGPCITQRAAIGNRANVAVSLHADGNLGRDAHGFHVIRPGLVPGYTGDIVLRSSRLATHLRDAMLARTSLATSTYIGTRGMDVRTDLGGLVLSDVPKVFLEAGNLRHPGDAAVLQDAAQQERIARAVADALVAWHVQDAALRATR